MSDTDEPRPGRVVWHDLTVPDAAGVRDFYREVIGWEVREVDMGGYSDYSMVAPGSDEVVAGVCHARGPNADLPAQWLCYVAVPDAEESARRCRAAGGEVLAGPRSVGGGVLVVVRDPAGAALALFQPGA